MKFSQKFKNHIKMESCFLGLIRFWTYTNAGMVNETILLLFNRYILKIYTVSFLYRYIFIKIVSFRFSYCFVTFIET